MPRIPRHLIKDQNRCYHIISRTTGQEFALGDVEKEFLMQRIRKLSSVYFVKVFTFCILSNHFHLLTQMQSHENYSDEEIERRFKVYYGHKRPFIKENINDLRKKWSDLSEYVKEIKQGFSFWYNRQHDRRGYFWSERFKSVVVEDGAALISCMAYIDLNAVRANLVDRPEDYRFCGLGHHVQSSNKNRFLSLDLIEFQNAQETPLVLYRRYVYEVGSLERSGWKRPIPEIISRKEERADYRITRSALFRYRSRYFTESVVLGSKVFVKKVYGKLHPYLKTRSNRDPVRIHGAGGLYSMKRLKEARPL